MSRLNYQMDSYISHQRSASCCNTDDCSVCFGCCRRQAKAPLMDKNEELGASFYDLLAKVEDDHEFLFELVELQDHRSIQKLLNHDQSLVNTTTSDKKRKSLLHVAAQMGHLSVMATLINYGIDINIQDEEGNTSIHDAVENDCKASISFLLHQGANPNILNVKKLSPTHLAVGHNKIEALKELLLHPSVDPNIPGEYDSTPLHFAAWRERPECADLLIQHGAEICRKNVIGLCALHVAAQSSSSGTMEVIMQKANSMGYGSREEILNKLSQEKNSPLHSGVMGGDIQIVKLCLKAGYDIAQEQENGNNSVHLAAAQGCVEIIKLLLGHKPENKEMFLKSTNNLGHTVLHEAAIFNRFEAVEFFINEGVDIDAKAKNGCNALLMAASKQAWRSLNLLLMAGSDWASRDENLRNVLHLIIMGCSQPGKFNACFKKEVMRSMLNESDKFGCTPLHYASRQGYRKTIAELLDMGAQLNVKSHKQQSALHFAASCGRINTCKELLKNISNTQLVNETDSCGQTPLHLAASGGHDKVVVLLLKIGAAICKDFKGNTPLHLAAVNGYTRAVRAILQIHPHLIDSTNKAKNTPLHLAVLESQTSTITLLLNLGAKMQTNIDDLYPLHVAISKELKDACVAFIAHDRWREAMDNKCKLFGCTMVGLIEHMPEVCQMVLDRCRTASGPDQRDSHFHYVYDFQYLQVDPMMIKEIKKDGVDILPLFALNQMVKHNRVECLYHPLCLAFLHSKWMSYGAWFHLLSMIFYGIFLTSITTFVVGFDFNRETMRTNMAFFNHTSNSSTNFSSEYDDGGLPFKRFKFSSLTLTQKASVNTIIAFIVMNIIKEILKAWQLKIRYLRDVDSCRELVASIFCGMLTIPLLMDICEPIQWQFGAFAVFLAWFNLLVYLQGFDVIGIYVVMFMEILKTLLQVILVFSVLIVAFGLAFYISLNTGTSPSFQTPQISLITSSVMMLGAIDYSQIWVDPDSKGQLPNQFLNYILLLFFILLMPILLINLLIGLAVGDIGAVLKNAKLKKISMQIQLYTGIEQKLPTRLIKLINKPSLKIFINSQCSKVQSVAMSMFTANSADDNNGQNDSLEQQSFLYREFHQQKMRLKQIQKEQAKNYDLLKLIIQKMEIQTEVEDFDEENSSDLSLTPKVDKDKESIGWSSAALKHSILKQAFMNWTFASRLKATQVEEEEVVVSTPR